MTRRFVLVVRVLLLKKIGLLQFSTSTAYKLVRLSRLIRRRLICLLVLVDSQIDVSIERVKRLYTKTALQVETRSHHLVSDDCEICSIKTTLSLNTCFAGTFLIDKGFKQIYSKEQLLASQFREPKSF